MKAKPDAVILREKDLSDREFELFAAKAKAACEQADTPLIINTFIETANKLGCVSHLPMPLLTSLSRDMLPRSYGTSCHSVREAIAAEELGCSYIIAGHIFDTDCKKGLPGRGLGFLSEVCRSTSLPVYAIGGIDESNVQRVKECGARGVCIMSGLMTCGDPQEYIDKIRERSSE